MVAVSLRIPRLERLLGCRIDEITVAVLERLLGDHVPEDLVIEYKAALYSRDAKGNAELKKDAAAMANAAGGLIVLGVGEDDQGAASRLDPVDLTDDERRRMVQILTTGIAPLLPELSLTPLPLNGDASKGFFLITVPPSMSAPHAVLDGDSMRWPVREDTHTRWMREPEVAGRYRDRYVGATGREELLSVRVREGLEGLRRGVDGWLVLVTLPERSGAMTIDGSAVARAQRWLAEAQSALPGTAFTGTGATVGRRRVVLSDGLQGTAKSSDWRLELHSDGGAFGAIQLALPALVDPGAPRAALICEPAELEGWILQLLGLAAHHAVAAGAGGQLLAQATVLGVHLESAPPIWQAPDGPQLSVGGIEVALADRRSGRLQQVPGTRTLGSPTALETVIPLDVAVDAEQLVAASALIAAELLAEFGVPDPEILKRDGTIDVPRAMKASQSLASWADQYGVSDIHRPTDSGAG